MMQYIFAPQTFSAHYSHCIDDTSFRNLFVKCSNRVVCINMILFGKSMIGCEPFALSHSLNSTNSTDRSSDEIDPRVKTFSTTSRRVGRTTFWYLAIPICFVVSVFKGIMPDWALEQSIIGRPAIFPGSARQWFSFAILWRSAHPDCVSWSIGSSSTRFTASVHRRSVFVIYGSETAL